MVGKNRYDKCVTNNRSLQRMFSSSSPGKYPTIGKFLPSIVNQQTVFPATTVKADDQKQDKNDVDLLDKLVNQALLSRSTTAQTAVQTDLQTDQVTSSRAKEFLANQAVVESVAESAPELAITPETAPTLEAAPNPEMAELSKELKEVSSETKEQREQAAIKEQQQKINNLVSTAATPVAVSDKPVVVLPITAKSKEEAKFKSTKYSVKWLVEWCVKVAKMFSGAVIYKEEIADE